MPGTHHRKDARLAFWEPYSRPYRRPKRTPADDFSEYCLTLEEDEITRCGEPLTRGERCRVHQTEYRTTYLSYKNASMRAKRLLQTHSIPSKRVIEGCDDFDWILRKIDHVYQYRELVQIERTGRDIHGRRFFLEPDGPHRRRLEFLDREIEQSSEAILALEERANGLRVEISRWQTDSSLSDFNDLSGDMSEPTSGTTPYTYHQEATYQVDSANIEDGGLEQPTNDGSTTTATDSESDSDLDLDLISYSDIAAMTLANLFYASVDYFFAK